jgi:hypothetical protein
MFLIHIQAQVPPGMIRTTTPVARVEQRLAQRNLGPPAIYPLSDLQPLDQLTNLLLNVGQVHKQALLNIVPIKSHTLVPRPLALEL